MIPQTTLSFSDFYVPEINFGLYDIYQFPKQQVIDEIPSIGVYDYFNPTPVATYTPIAAVQQTFQPVAVVVPKKTITFTVADGTETIPGANIAVNGVGTATTDINGRVTLPNVSLNDSIRISYIGFEDYVGTVSTIPSIVVLKEGAIMLDEVIIQAWKKPVASSNTWAWLLLGAVGVAAAYKFSKSGTKIVRAKI